MALELTLLDPHNRKIHHVRQWKSEGWVCVVCGFIKDIQCHVCILFLSS